MGHGNLSKAMEADLIARGAKIGPSMAEMLEGTPSGPADGEWTQKPAKEKRPKQRKTVVADVVWTAFGLPIPATEYRFCERRWKVDWAWVDKKVALECEGGSWSHGGHTRGSGFRRDMAKYNRLTVLGWSLLRCTPEEIKDGSIFPTIRQALRLEDVT